MLTSISPAADDLVVTAEVGSQAEYDPHLEWPGGASGVTLGIGYDLGYATIEQFDEEWGTRLPAVVANRLRQAVGVHGDAAAHLAQGLHDVVIPWQQAREVFDVHDVPRTIAETAATFPGADKLPADSFGALFSLVFNRGTQVTSSNDTVALRRIEMLQIRNALAQGRPKDIPAYIRAMKRLWPASSGLKGLCIRRDAEAALFEKGLQSAPQGA